MEKFIERYGPWAVVTGAARGIGKAFACKIASYGISLILIDVLQEELDKTAKEITDIYAVKVHPMIADLNDPLAVKEVVHACESYSVGLFCCNHAASHLFSDGKLRRWLDTSWEDLQAILQINLNSSLELLYFFAKKMRAKQRGGIILVSSGAALTGTPYLAHYSATKAFLANLGESLWWELKPEGIDVITVLPGATSTPGALKFFSSEGKEHVPFATPESVALATIKALGKKMRIFPGWKHALQCFLTDRIMPRKWAVYCFGKFFPQILNVAPDSKHSHHKAETESACEKL